MVVFHQATDLPFHSVTKRKKKKKRPPNPEKEPAASLRIDGKPHARPAAAGRQRALKKRKKTPPVHGFQQTAGRALKQLPLLARCLGNLVWKNVLKRLGRGSGIVS